MNGRYRRLSAGAPSSMISEFGERIFSLFNGHYSSEISSECRQLDQVQQLLDWA